MAIGIRVKKVLGDYDLGSSKFFGTPTVPLDWEEDFYEDEIFFCQIRLRDIAELDKEDRLPHEGYLYVFLHTENGKYHMEADIRYSKDDPELAIEDFNLAVEDYEDFTDGYLMEFYETDDSNNCTRLLGEPSDWNYEELPPKLLMQFDPLDSEMGFLDDLDGFLYLFFGKDEKNFGTVELKEEYS